MMDHIRQYDWCASGHDSMYFLSESDMDNCITERILRNKFYDPLAINNPDTEERPKINWDQVFKKQDNNKNRLFRIHCPGHRSLPPYPKLSSLTNKQHYQCLKVICAQNLHILPQDFIPRPTKSDQKVYEDLKETYDKEIKEFKDWARTLWTNGQCIRALRPKPQIEMVYEAEFKMKANKVKSFPKIYHMAAQIPLESNVGEFNMVTKKNLKSVKVTDLPRIHYADMLTKKCNVIEACAVPEPCEQHPTQFILPNEDTLSVLPLTEVHRELAQYAYDNGAQYVASENALKCLVEIDKSWNLPLSVCQIMGPDGDTNNIVVLGSSFSVHREAARTRSYHALKHLLHNAIVPDTEKSKLQTRQRRMSITSTSTNNQVNDSPFNNAAMDDDSDEEDMSLVIDAEEMDTAPSESNKERLEIDPSEVEAPKEISPEKSKDKMDSSGIFSCTCKDSDFEKPPPRSYRKWQINNYKTNETYDLIIHCAHKVRDESGEVIVEPIPEYQLDLGGSEQSKSKIKSLVLSLLLRKEASLLNVRIDGSFGEVVTVESSNLKELTKTEPEMVQQIYNTIHTTLNQIQGLLPGNYILHHDVSHGPNCLLYVARSTGQDKLTLDFDCSQLADADETKDLKTAPVITPVLLPVHKLRKILPCAFTTIEAQLAKELKRPPHKQKIPPQAIKWPKRNTKKTKK